MITENSLVASLEAARSLGSAAPPAPLMSLRSTPHAPPPGMAVSDARILLVDDEPINTKVVRKYLTMAGYSQFQSTCNPREVLPMMIRQEPDVVLLDIVMPQFNGL